MSLDRRTLLQSGAITAGVFAFSGLGLERAMAAPGALAAAPIRGALLGWLIIAPDGGGRFSLVELDARSQPVREIAAERFDPGSLTSLTRQASAAARRSAAASWGVSFDACATAPGRIEHRASRRSVPLVIWTDFA